MPEDDETGTEPFNYSTSDFSQPVAAQPEAAPEDDGTVKMHMAAPWRFSSFNTPALPGVTLTPEWQTYDRETAETLYHEATRCGFTVSSSVDFSALTTEGGQ